MRGLEKTRTGLFARMGSLFSRDLDESFYEALEETLILADVGVETTAVLVSRLRERVKAERVKKGEDAKALIAQIAAQLMDNDGPDFAYPLLLLVVGVNGAGKTTTIGKLSVAFARNGKRVLLAAGDTFRAAAAEQLGIWATRTGAMMVRGLSGSDPASVLFDAIQAGKARSCDVVICDTAGRLHNRKNLMDELAKMRRVTEREFSGCVKTLLVLDATTGLNGMEQAKVFSEVSKVDGIALTKLDGTAKGGVALAVANGYGIPVWYCGTGESVEDLIPFDAMDFARSLFL
jgi:fused signal recognition particle receptor